MAAGAGRDLAPRGRQLDARRHEAAQIPVAREMADADGASGHDQLLRPAVRRKRVAQPGDIDAGHEKVRILRIHAEQTVADRATDDVRVELE
jgi:hypothetical protein